jgi:hypothetical protein
MTALILKRASASRSSGERKDEDYDVLADGKAVGRIYGRCRGCDSSTTLLMVATLSATPTSSRSGLKP